MKRIISAALAVILSAAVLTFLPLSANIGDFTDVGKDAWYYPQLEWACENGFVNGTDANTFLPTGNITRGMMVTLLGRFVGADVSGGTRDCFTDVDNTRYYSVYITWAYSVKSAHR